MRKVHKCLNLSEETSSRLSDLKDVLGCSSVSEVVTMLVNDKIEQLANGAAENNDQVITLLKTIIKICRTTEEQSYVTYDALNNYLLYLAEDGSLSDYRSCDTELSLSNRQNRSDYYEKAHANYTIKIKNGQQHKTTL